MAGKFVQAVLLVASASLTVSLALETGKLAVLIAVAVGLLSWFVWALWRIIVLCRARGFRTGAEPSQRESFGFAAGVIMATPAIILLFLTTFLVERSPDEWTITAGSKRALEIALDAYHADTGSYPTNNQGLEALTVNPGVPRWAGPYITAELRQCIGWFDYSAGTDGKPVLIARPKSDRRLP